MNNMLTAIPAELLSFTPDLKTLFVLNIPDTRHLELNLPNKAAL